MWEWVRKWIDFPFDCKLWLWNVWFQHLPLCVLVYVLRSFPKVEASFSRSCAPLAPSFLWSGWNMLLGVMCLLSLCKPFLRLVMHLMAKKQHGKGTRFCKPNWINKVAERIPDQQQRVKKRKNVTILIKYWYMVRIQKWYKIQLLIDRGPTDSENETNLYYFMWWPLIVGLTTRSRFFALFILL